MKRLRKWRIRHLKLLIHVSNFTILFVGFTLYTNKTWELPPLFLILVSLFIMLLCQTWRKGMKERQQIGRNMSFLKAGYYDQYRTCANFMPMVSGFACASLMFGWINSAVYFVGIQLVLLLILTAHRQDLKHRSQQ